LFRHTAHRQARSSRESLKTTRITNQNAFDWIDPDRAAGKGCSLFKLAPNFRTSGTPFQERQLARPVRVMGRRCSLLLLATDFASTSAKTSPRHRPPRRGHFLPISATDLLSNEHPSRSANSRAGTALTVPTVASGPALSHARLCACRNNTVHESAG